MAEQPGMIAERPLPAPDPWSKGFWEACRDGRLEMQRCSTCGKLRFTPRPMCPSCHSLDWGYVPVSGRGTIYSWIVVRPPVMPAFRSKVPFAVVLVELEESEELRMVGNLVDCDVDAIAFGLPVEVTFEKVDDEISLPQWRPRGK
jgi:uncharacterized protein